MDLIHLMVAIVDTPVLEVPLAIAPPLKLPFPLLSPESPPPCGAGGPSGSGPPSPSGGPSAASSPFSAPSPRASPPSSPHPSTHPSTGRPPDHSLPPSADIFLRCLRDKMIEPLWFSLLFERPRTQHPPTRRGVQPSSKRGASIFFPPAPGRPVDLHGIGGF